MGGRDQGILSGTHSPGTPGPTRRQVHAEPCSRRNTKAPSVHGSASVRSSSSFFSPRGAAIPRVQAIRSPGAAEAPQPGPTDSGYRCSPFSGARSLTRKASRRAFPAVRLSRIINAARSSSPNKRRREPGRGSGHMVRSATQSRTARPQARCSPSVSSHV